MVWSVGVTGTKGEEVLGGEAGFSSARAGRGATGWHRPRTRELAAFVVLVALGFLAWLAAAPGITSRILGVALPPILPTGSLLSIFEVSLVCGVLALVAGFALPNGFYLWGIALNLHAPFTEGLTVYMMEQDGIDLAGGMRGLVGYVMISLTLFVFTVLLYTALSALGMAVRYLGGRILHR